ncbi:MAG: hypothetical protein ACJ8FS_10475 [Sphingomicrobium sp.]
MLVYGDRREIAEPAEQQQCLSRKLRLISASAPGLERHAKLVSCLIEAGRLVQGVEDAGYPAGELRAFLHRLAGCVVRSWDSRFAQLGELPPVPGSGFPARVELRLPEGFAFYAVYPEAYAVAARRLRLKGPPRVIGIRSIGTTLGAVVAATLGAPPATTVRPFGDPFARQVELPPEIMDLTAHYVIVDEGPGLSGSSFAAVADWLQQRAVPLERIAFLPSHSGDLGPQASTAHRQRWNRAQRVPAEFDAAFLAERFGPLEEFSTGSRWERRKYRATRGGERLLLKFAGLGAIGERKLAMARSLHAAGFTPQPLGLVHGFLVERWCEGSPLGQDEKPVREIGRYVGARARLFPADRHSGASVEELLTMCRRNVSLALGPEAVRAVDRWEASGLPQPVSRVRTDNKVDRHEWLRAPGGRLLKTDALDHHQAHDLIGCQAVEWDVAAAITEFALDDAEAAGLIAATDCLIDPRLLQFYRLAYSAFRVGQAALQARSDPEVERRAEQLRGLLHQHVCRETRHESLVG